MSTEPPGSAIATTRESTADPLRACHLRSAARRANLSGMSSITSQVFSSRLADASRAASPCSASIITGAGTTGGHKPLPWSSMMKAPVTRDRSERREIAPESRTSNSAGRQFGSTGESESKRPGPGYLFCTGLSDFVEKFTQIQIGFLQDVQASKFDPDRFLEQPRRCKPALVDRPVEIVGKISLHSRHTPHYTHIQVRLLTG